MQPTVDDNSYSYLDAQLKPRRTNSPEARSQKRRENGEGRIETIATTDRENIAPANWTVVAMWFCFLLGVACVLFGIDGIYTSFSQEASSVRFEWLGFGYVPLLRGTAVASVVLEECWCAGGGRIPDPKLFLL